MTCSGKSTLARRLACQSGRTIYETDPHFDQHCRRATKTDQPTMFQFQTDKTWVEDVRSMSVQARAKVWLGFYRERFHFILQDLQEMESSSLVAVGVDLLPEMLTGIYPRRAIWLVPTRDFFERHYYDRDFVTASPQGDEVWNYYTCLIDHHKSIAGEKVIEMSGDKNPDILVGELLDCFLDPK